MLKEKITTTKDFIKEHKNEICLSIVSIGVIGVIGYKNRETINKLTRTRSLVNKSHYFKEDEIESIEVFDVKKSKIEEYLLSIGIDKEKLRAIAKKIYINKEIPSDLVEINNKLKNEYGCYFNCASKE